MRTLIRLFFPALLMSLLPWGAFADVVWLKNGDRITGEVQSLDSKRLLLKMPGGRAVVLDWGTVQTLRCDSPLLIRHDALEHGITTKLTEAEAGMVKLEDGSTIALSEIDSFTRPVVLVGDWRWEGHLDLNYDSSRKNDQRSNHLTTFLDVRARQFNWRHHLKADSDSESKQKKKTTDRWSAAYAVDRLIDPRWFWRAHAKRDRDDLHSPKRQDEIGTGPGYRFYDTVGGHFELIAELTRFTAEATTSGGGFTIDVDSEYNALSLSWDWNHKLFAAALELYSTGIAYKPGTVAVTAILRDAESSVPVNFDYTINYAVDMDAGLRYHLNQYINASLRFKYKHDSSEDLKSTDKRYYVGLGLKW